MPSLTRRGKRLRTSIALFDQQQFSRALEVAWSLVGAVDKYIVETQPWALGEKQDDESRSRLATILYTSAEALRIVTALAHPVIPEATAKIWGQLGLGDIRQVSALGTAMGTAQVGDPAGRGSVRLSARRQEHNRKDAENGRAGTQRYHCGRRKTGRRNKAKTVDAPAAPANIPRPDSPRPCPMARSVLMISQRSNCAWGR